VIDPLDGTTNYLYRFPAWAVSVAVEDAEGGVAGVVLDPVRGDLFAAERGRGFTVNGEPARVREPVALERALIATGFSYERERRAEQSELLTQVLPRVRDIRRAGAAALDLSMVAAGRVDGYYERGLQPWDWAAGRLAVAEAGGTVVELEGDPIGLVAASTRELADELVSLVG
jgi:myo-inositol-1(or 4)-monophosphatase